MRVGFKEVSEVTEALRRPRVDGLSVSSTWVTVKWEFLELTTALGF